MRAFREVSATIKEEPDGALAGQNPEDCKSSHSFPPSCIDPTLI
jgi:hypothetical protein